MNPKALTLLAPVALAASSMWLGAEVALRVTKPQLFDEESRAAERLTLDPKAGTVFPIKGGLARGRVAYIWVGGCNSCSAHALSLADVKTACPSDTRVVLLAAPSNGAAGKTAGLPTLVLDRQGQEAVNASFAPRVYIVEDGVLRKAQPLNAAPLDVLRGASRDGTDSR